MDTRVIRIGADMPKIHLRTTLTLICDSSKTVELQTETFRVENNDIRFEIVVDFTNRRVMCRSESVLVSEEKWSPKIGQCYKVESGLIKGILKHDQTT